MPSSVPFAFPTNRLSRWLAMRSDWWWDVLCYRYDGLCCEAITWRPIGTPAWRVWLAAVVRPLAAYVD